MKTKLFLTVMFSLALTLGLVITGCENGTTDEETIIAWGAITAPNVTVQPVDGGIILSWSPIIGASSYEVYRKNNAGVDVFTGGQANYNADPKTGKFYYRDLISDDNSLAVGTRPYLHGICDFIFTYLGKQSNNG